MTSALLSVLEELDLTCGEEQFVILQ